MITRRSVLATASTLTAAAALAACGKPATESNSPASASASAAGSATGAAAGSGGAAAKKVSLKIVYLEAPPGHTLTDLFKAAKVQYETANPGSTEVLEPINATETAFYTKLALMQRSSSTAPDLVYEDSFQVNADATAGFLQPLDGYVGTWADWSQYGTSVRAEGTGLDGKLYAIPLETDVQVIWYNKRVFAKAGLPTTWQPTSWADILSAARAVKKLPGVTPINIYATKAEGEATTLRGVENLLAGTAGSLDATLYSHQSGKWMSGSKGMLDALTFLHTAYQEKMLPSTSSMEDPNLSNAVNNVMFPTGKLAMMVDGNWVSGSWGKTGSNPWGTWRSDVGVAALPTQDGAGAKRTSMSGGWTLAISSRSQNKDAAWELLKLINSRANNLAYVLASSNIPLRNDVISDAAYSGSAPGAAFFAQLLKGTNYRPALTAYPQVSELIMKAAESVTVGNTAPATAQATYDSALSSTVGADKVGQASA